MKALSIKQPWLWLIVADTKRIENRTWKPPQSIIGQRIALHASAKADADAMLIYGECIAERAIGELPLGAIVATATVRGFVTNTEDPWFAGPVGWVLADVQKLAQPVSCKGALGLWTVPDDVMAKMEVQP